MLSKTLNGLSNTCMIFFKLPSMATVTQSWTYNRYYSLLVTKDNLETPEVPKALDITEEDLSIVTPYFRKSFNIAAYINNSETLQNLIHLNVDLSKIEKKTHIVEKFLRLDFENDMKKHILFLQDYIGMDNVGKFITKNPMIFYEDLDNLKTRVNYLSSKNFTDDQIQRIIDKNPFWLSFSTVRIDRRFGYYQECFELSGKEVRQLATKQPKLITYNLHHIKTNTFTIKEEMGFEDGEVKSILLSKPRIFMLNQRALLERFNYVHNVMKIDHKSILENPELLQCRAFKIKQRHLFLQNMGRAQYNPKKENFIPLTALIMGSDSEFCNNYAKCNINDFNTFLKTM